MTTRTGTHGRAPLKAHSALGTPGKTPQRHAKMGLRAQGHRRDIDWMPARETPIVARTDRLEITKGNWEMRVCHGVFESTAADCRTIRAAMTVKE